MRRSLTGWAISLSTAASQNEDENAIDEDMSVIRSSYRRTNSEKELRIVKSNSNDISRVLSEWID